MHRVDEAAYQTLGNPLLKHFSFNLHMLSKHWQSRQGRVSKTILGGQDTVMDEEWLIHLRYLALLRLRKQI
jgi:hypothetical protein